MLSIIKALFERNVTDPLSRAIGPMDRQRQYVNTVEQNLKADFARGAIPQPEFTQKMAMARKNKFNRTMGTQNY